MPDCGTSSIRARRLICLRPSRRFRRDEINLGAGRVHRLFVVEIENVAHLQEFRSPAFADRPNDTSVAHLTRRPATGDLSPSGAR